MALYCRISTADRSQTVANQLRNRLAVAVDGLIGVAIHCDEDFSDAKRRDKRAALITLLQPIHRCLTNQSGKVGKSILSIADFRTLIRAPRP